MPTSIEAQGVTVEEAIQVALNQLGVTRDRVEIEIVHHPRSGFLGLGARRAKVRATVREAFLADGEEYDMSSGERIGRGARRGRRSRRKRGRRGEGRQDAEPQRGRDERDTRDERREPRDTRSRDARPRDAREGAGRERESREGRGRERERDGREREGRERDSRERDARGRGEGRERDSREPRDVRRDDATAPEHGRERGRRGRGRDRDADREQRGRGESRRDFSEADARSRGAADDSRARGAEPPASLSAAPVREDERRPNDAKEARPPAAEAQAEDMPARTTPSPELQHRAEQLVFELLTRMGFQPRVSSTYDTDEGEIVVRVEAEAEGLLIGRRGQTLDAIEHVVNRMTNAGESAAETRVALDVGGYRDRRRDTLLELADRLKVRVLTQGRRIQVSPMSPRDRRILQSVLGADDSVRTRVLGTGFYRRVVIFPVGLEEESVPLEADDEGLEAAPLGEEEAS